MVDVSESPLRTLFQLWLSLSEFWESWLQIKTKIIKRFSHLCNRKQTVFVPRRSRWAAHIPWEWQLDMLLVRWGHSALLKIIDLNWYYIVDIILHWAKVKRAMVFLIFTFWTLFFSMGTWTEFKMILLVTARPTLRLLHRSHYFSGPPYDTGTSFSTPDWVFCMFTSSIMSGMSTRHRKAGPLDSSPLLCKWLTKRNEMFCCE